MASFTIQNPVIYTITNMVNGKIYVGYTSDFVTRKSKHLSDLRANKHSNRHLQYAFNKDGEQNFTYEILEEASKKEFLPSLENYWCNLLQTHNPTYGYNCNSTGDFALVDYSNRVTSKNIRIVSEKTKNLIKKARKNQIITDDHKMKISQALIGRKREYKPQTKERVQQRISSIRENAKKRGTWFSNLTNQKRTESIRNRYAKPFVVQNEDVIFRFQNLYEAAAVFSVKNATIWAALNRKNNLYRGFTFKYLEVL